MKTAIYAGAALVVAAVGYYLYSRINQISTAAEKAGNSSQELTNGINTGIAAAVGALKAYTSSQQTTQPNQG